MDFVLIPHCQAWTQRENLFSGLKSGKEGHLLQSESKIKFQWGLLTRKLGSAAILMRYTVIDFFNCPFTWISCLPLPLLLVCREYSLGGIILHDWWKSELLWSNQQQWTTQTEIYRCHSWEELPEPRSYQPYNQIQECKKPWPHKGRTSIVEQDNSTLPQLPQGDFNPMHRRTWRVICRQLQFQLWVNWFTLPVYVGRQTAHSCRSLWNIN